MPFPKSEIVNHSLLQHLTFKIQHSKFLSFPIIASSPLSLVSFASMLHALPFASFYRAVVTYHFAKRTGDDTFSIKHGDIKPI